MKKYLQFTAACCVAIGMIACGGNNANKDQTKTEEHTDHQGHEDHSEMKEQTADLLPIPEGASVDFGKVEQKNTVIDSATGEERFVYHIEFVAEGIEVEPAGELNEGKGHHHLIINGEPIPRGTIVPADSVNIHYGKGQTETEIELARGKYQLTMQFADGYHQSYGKQLSATINLVVE